MTNDDCVLMRNALESIVQPSFESIKQFDEDKQDYMFHAKFLWAVSKNKRVLDTVVKDLEEANKNSDEYQEYLDARNKIIERYSSKDPETGAPLRQEVNMGGRIGSRIICPDMSDPNSKCSKEIDKLEKENKAVIDARKEQTDQFKKLLEEEADVAIQRVPFSMVPEGISPAAMDGIMFMVEDPDDMRSEPLEKPKPKKK